MGRMDSSKKYLLQKSVIVFQALKAALILKSGKNEIKKCEIGFMNNQPTAPIFGKTTS